MDNACISPGAFTLLGAIGVAVQAAIVGLFWVGIKALQAHIADAKEVRDRALELNEQLIQTNQQAVGAVGVAVRPQRRA